MRETKVGPRAESTRWSLNKGPELTRLARQPKVTAGPFALAYSGQPLRSIATLFAPGPANAGNRLMDTRRSRPPDPWTRRFSTPTRQQAGNGRPGQTEAVVRVAVRRMVPVAVGGPQPRGSVVPRTPAKHAGAVIRRFPIQHRARRPPAKRGHGATPPSRCGAHVRSPLLPHGHGVTVPARIAYSCSLSLGNRYVLPVSRLSHSTYAFASFQLTHTTG